MIIGSTIIVNGQVICGGCKCEEEPFEAEYSAEIGETPGEMTLSEADIMGTEAGESLGGAAEEISTEILAETIAEASVEALPGVGQIIGALIFTGTILYEIFTEQHQEQQVREHELANILSGGTFTLPVYPSFSISANDLNGKRNRLSYMFFIKKSYNEDDIREYLKTSGQDKYIGQTRDMAYLNNHMVYAFTNYVGFVGNNDPAGNRIPIRYEKKVAEVRLSKLTESSWIYSIVPEWKHNLEHSYTKNTIKTVGQGNSQRDYTYETTENIRLNTIFQGANSGAVEFWIATSNKDGSFTYLAKVSDQNLSIRDHGADRLVVRIKNLDISAYSGRYSTLFITMRLNYNENWVYYNGRKAMPQNWNPTVENSAFSLTHSERLTSYYTLGAPSPNNYTTNIAFSESGIYPDTSYPLRPAPTDGNLVYFKIHDYQPVDNDASIAIATNPKLINPYPKIYVTGQTVFKNRTILPPQYGRTHIMIEVPFNNNWKQIEYIEMENLSNQVTAIYNHKVENGSNSGTKKFTLSGYYNDGATSNNVLDVETVIPSAQSVGTPDIGFNNYHDNVSLSGTTIYKQYLLYNVPVGADHSVSVNVHYDDGSLSKQTVNIGAANNVVPRAYYTFRNNFRNLVLRHGTLEDGSDRADWLVEYLSTGTYAIANRGTGKVLGFIDGKYGVYDWNPLSEGLHWSLEFDTNSHVKLYNIGQKAYLDLNEEGQLGFNFNDGLLFGFEKRIDAEPVLEETPIYISNRLNGSVLENNDQNIPALRPKSTLKERDRKAKMIYTGCFTYAIQNNASGKYLHYDPKNNLQWKENEYTVWFLKNTDNDYFSLATTQGRLLGHNPNIANAIYVDAEIGENIDETPTKFQFKIVNQLKNDELIAHYSFDSNSLSENRIKDLSSYANDGTVYNELNYLDDIERGLVPKFDGTNKYIDTNYDFDPLELTDLSISFWMKTSSWGDSNAVLIGGRNWSVNRDGSTNGIKIHTYHQGGNLRYEMDSGNVSNMTGENWHHVSLVLDSQDNGTVQRTLYIDGVQVNTSTVPYSFMSVVNNQRPNTVIGNWFNGASGRSFNGSIDEVKLWRVALSSSQIQEEYTKTKKEEPLLAHYKFDENGEDATVYKNHATLTDVSFTNDTKRGLVAGFNGNNSSGIVNQDFNPRKYEGDQSIAFWIKISSIHQDDRFHNEAIFLGSKQLGFSLKANGELVTFMNSQTENRIDTRGGNVYDNTWHHVMAVYDTRNNNIIIKLYLDGQLIRENTTSENFNLVPSTFGIGRLPKILSHYIGSFDDIKIWKKALTQDEVTKEYNDTRIELNGPIALYAFENNANDTSGNNHHGTIVNTVNYVNDTDRGTVARFEGGYVDTRFDFNPNNYNGDLSVSFWMKNKTEAKPFPNILGAANFSFEKNNNKLFGIVKTNNPNDNRAASGIQSSTEMEEGAWYHVTYIMDTQPDGKIHRKIFVNGELDQIGESKTSYSFKNNSGLTSIGINFLKNDWSSFDGYLDDVIFWDKALSDSEVQYIYKTKIASVQSPQSQARTVAPTEERLDKFVIYPNPSDGIFYVKYNTKQSLPVTYRIYNMQGQLIYNQNKKSAIGDNLFKIEKQGLSGGVYLFEINMGGITERKQIIIK